MEIQFLAPTVRQVANQVMDCPELKEIICLKGQETGLQVSVTFDRKVWLSLNEETSLPWNGLIHRYRLAILGEGLEANAYFEGMVQDDDGQNKKDRILEKQAGFLERGCYAFWIDLKGLSAGTHLLTAQLYEREGYGQEQLVASCELTVEVADLSLEEGQEPSFFLDLWQHLSALARYYQVPLWSEDHFRLIENYMTPLAQAGQKVCDLVISDYSWAGQDCYHVTDNPSSLFEYNIVGLSVKNGTLHLDFSAMDRYIKLCDRLGMAEEINLFGILGNWDGRTFGKPIKDYLDPIRLEVYDKDQGSYTFLTKKEELADYLNQVFAHLQNLGVWSKVQVIADEPNDPALFADFEAFLQSCSDQPIVFKHACLHGDFLENYEGNFDSNSVISSVFIDKMGQEYSKIWQHRQEMTWYNCCFPQNLNVFVRSPLMESYLIGYLTYAFGLKGFLRWNYCLWTEDPNRDITYKTYKWAAGDMFFVYPGRSGRPEFSLRFKNLCMGIADWRLLKAVEKVKGKAFVDSLLEPIIGDVHQMTYDKVHDRIGFSYTENYDKITALKRQCLEVLKGSSL